MAGISRAERLKAVARLLQERTVSSQRELVRALEEEGIRATQATLSRDLALLGAVRSRTPSGQVIYWLPREGLEGLPQIQLERMLRDFVVEVEVSGNLVVVKTPPAGAQPVAGAIDRASLRNVLGTVAGDDTLLVVCREGKAREVARELGWKGGSRRQARRRGSEGRGPESASRREGRENGRSLRSRLLGGA